MPLRDELGHDLFKRLGWDAPDASVDDVEAIALMLVVLRLRDSLELRRRRAIERDP